MTSHVNVEGGLLNQVLVDDSSMGDTCYTGKECTEEFKKYKELTPRSDPFPLGNKDPSPHLNQMEKGKFYAELPVESTTQNQINLGEIKLEEGETKSNLSTTRNMSRIMEKEEEEEHERLRLERMVNGRRRGAFYAADTSNNSKRIDFDPNNVEPEPPDSNSGLLTLNSTHSYGNIQCARYVGSRPTRVHCGYAETIGRRPHMEDAFSFIGDLKRGYDFFGLFDGHRGIAASNFAAERMGGILLDRMNKNKHNLYDALRDAFSETNDKMREENVLGGTTAVVGVVGKHHCTIAHVGDSRAVLCTRGKAVTVTQDHKPDRLDEIQRITELGGEITNIVTKNGMYIIASYFVYLISM